MSGRKQHYIPQVLLRGFGKRGKGKAVQVTVYSRDHGVFTTATEGVAAQRYFYSEHPADPGAETLDDRITTYEYQLAKIIAEFRDTTPGHAVDPAKAAEMVTHLCVRQAHLRDSFASATEQLLHGAASIFRDKDRARKALGLDDPNPKEILLDEINTLYEKFSPQLGQLGITKPVFEQWVLANSKAIFDYNFAEQSPFLQGLFSLMQGQTDKIARQGHIKALEQSLAPDPRTEVLKQFDWRIEQDPASGFVLPDCVAISLSEGASYRPLAYAGKDEMDTIFMPLSHNRLLVGAPGGAIEDVPQTVNNAFVACSWDCFIARDRTPEFEQLVSQIGERTRGLIDDIVGEAFGDYE
ncbi:MAG: DUF4238 domain-containing protein [Proteobacteria bacterium]|nr:DUF4238 domain-containing protein [Pseudomonadota bacterium]